MQLTRLLDAPIALVWEVLTDPTHITEWWGPEGFTISISTMDVRPGGQWNFVMHGPDGRDYQNKIIYKEVVPHKKLVLEYHTTATHVTTIELEERGQQTLLKWHMSIESEELLIQLVKNFKADKGLEQTVEKWNGYLRGLQNI